MRCSALHRPQISAFLETFESVAEVYQRRPEDAVQRATRHTHSEQHEITWNLLQTTLSLVIPLEATPLFVTSAGASSGPG